MRDFIEKSSHCLPPSNLFRSSCTQRRAAYADSLNKQWFHFGETTAFSLKPPLRQRSGMPLSLLAVGISLRYRPCFSWCRRLDGTHFSAQTFKWRLVSEAARREAPNDPKTSPTRTCTRASAVFCFLPSPLHLCRVKC